MLEDLLCQAQGCQHEQIQIRTLLSLLSFESLGLARSSLVLRGALGRWS